MEELNEHVVEEGSAKKVVLNPQYVLSGAILLAALIISGTLIFTHNSGSNGTAQIGGNAGQPGNNPAAAANVKVASDDHILGNANAKVSIIEYADYRCPFCEKLYTDSVGQIISNYVNTGKANFVFRNYAFLGQQSTWASEAAECAADQNKFWQYHDWLYKNQAPETNLDYYSKDNLIKYAGQVGLNTSQFASCLNSDKFAQKVASDLSGGQAAGVTGTPTVFINGTPIVGAQPYSAFQTAIEAALK